MLALAMRNRLGAREYLGAFGACFVLSAGAVVTVVVTGCSDRGEVREWRPTDHTQPPGVQATGPRPSGAAAPSPDEARLRAGAAIYRSQCAACHGDAGRGDGPASGAGAPPPDLTSAAFHEARTDEALLTVISGGRGAMPGFASQLGASGLAAAVAYVRSLRAVTPAPAPAPSPAPAPTPDGTPAPTPAVVPHP